MKIGIMQPYIFPYIGYFQLINAVDKYVIYDDVNYIKNGWVAHNCIIVNNTKHMFSIQMHQASVNKLFNQVEIKDNFKKLIKTLQMNYKHALHKQDTLALLEDICSYRNKHIHMFVMNSIIKIFQYLGIEKEIILSSNVKKDISLKGEMKVIEICKNLNGTEYYNAIGGRELYSKETFRANNLNLLFIESNIEPYNQNLKNNEFIPNLSIIDVLMNNSKEKIKELLNQYRVV